MNETNYTPPTWKRVTLDEIGIVVSGGTPSTKEPEFWNGDISWITPADLSNYEDAYISKGHRNISQVGLEYSSATLLPENSLLFSSRAPIGYVAIAKNKIATNQGFKNLVFDSKSLNPKYLYYYLKTITELAENMASGTTFLELSGTKFKQIPFPLAPIEEQDRIVKKIDELFSIINNSLESINNALDKAKLYVEKLIHNLFHGNLLNQGSLGNLPKDWHWKSLNDVGQIINGGTPKTKTLEYWDGNIPWITPADLSNYSDVYISSGHKYITDLGLENSSAKLIPKGAVLFSCRAPIGYVAIAKNELATNQGFKSIVPFEGINNIFLYYYLKSIKAFANKIASGTTFLELSTEKFKRIPIPVPPIDQQDKFVTEIEEAVAYSDNLIRDLKSLAVKAVNTKARILKDAYQGKLSEQRLTDSSVNRLLNNFAKFNNEYNINLALDRSRPKTLRDSTTLKEIIDEMFEKQLFRLEDIIALNLLPINKIKSEWNTLLENGYIKKKYDKQLKVMQFTKQ